MKHFLTLLLLITLGTYCFDSNTYIMKKSDITLKKYISNSLLFINVGAINEQSKMRIDYGTSHASSFYFISFCTFPDSSSHK